MVLYCCAVVMLTGMFWGVVLWTHMQLHSVPKPVALPAYLSLAVPDDNDVKVAPSFGSKKPLKDTLEPSEEEIQCYFKHKCCQNLEHARQLGKKLGEQILSFQPQTEPVVLTEQETMLARMLYLFVTEDCVRCFVHDPILCKLVLAQINDTISIHLPNFYSNSYQYRSYTVYKMCLREERRSSPEHKAVQIGRCWAQMVDKTDAPLFCAIGKKLYLWMKYRCEQSLEGISFVPIA